MENPRSFDELVWEEALMSRVPENVLLMVLRYILGADIDKAKPCERLKSHVHPHELMSPRSGIVTRDGGLQPASPPSRNYVMDKPSPFPLLCRI